MNVFELQQHLRDGACPAQRRCRGCSTVFESQEACLDHALACDAVKITCKICSKQFDSASMYSSTHPCQKELCSLFLQLSKLEENLTNASTQLKDQTGSLQDESPVPRQPAKNQTCNRPQLNIMRLSTKVEKPSMISQPSNDFLGRNDLDHEDAIDFLHSEYGRSAKDGRRQSFAKTHKPQDSEIESTQMQSYQQNEEQHVLDQFEKERLRAKIKEL